MQRMGMWNYKKHRQYYSTIVSINHSNMGVHVMIKYINNSLHHCVNKHFWYGHLCDDELHSRGSSYVLFVSTTTSGVHAHVGVHVHLIAPLPCYVANMWHRCTCTSMCMHTLVLRYHIQCKCVTLKTCDIGVAWAGMCHGPLQAVLPIYIVVVIPPNSTCKYMCMYGGGSATMLCSNMWHQCTCTLMCCA